MVTLSRFLVIGCGVGILIPAQKVIGMTVLAVGSLEETTAPGIEGFAILPQKILAFIQCLFLGGQRDSPSFGLHAPCVAGC